MWSKCSSNAQIPIPVNSKGGSADTQNSVQRTTSAESKWRPCDMTGHNASTVCFIMDTTILGVLHSEKDLKEWSCCLVMGYLHA